MRIACCLVTFGLILTAFVRPAFAWPPEDPKPANSSQAGPAEPPNPIYLFLNAPNDREAFWKMLGKPDQVVLDGDLYRKLREEAQAGKTPAAAEAAVVEAVSISGEVVGAWAKLVVEYRLTMDREGPAWVSIHLDGLTLSEAKEGPKDLPTRMTETRGWQIELRGQGEHVAQVGLLATVRSSAEGRRVDLAIPPAASTRIEMTVPQAVLDATAGTTEKVAIVGLEGKSGSRLSARLGPRPRLELAWRERADSAVNLPPLLSAKGDIAIEIERGSIRTRSTWGVAAIRGTVNQLTLRVDPTEELLEAEVENRPVQFETHREAGRSVITIPLTEPLRPNSTRGLTLSTRRAIASSGTVRVAIQGYSFDQAKVQTGMIAVARTGPLFLNPNPGRGLRRIDPRTELPDSLRNRAEAVLAFEFSDQPFELGLGIEPAPPRLRVETRTTATIDPRSARLQTRLDCSIAQGKVFDLQVLLPGGLDFEGAEPADVVESVQIVSLDPKSALEPGIEVLRMLTIVLTPQAREVDSFAIVLKGRCAIDPSRPIALPLFRPIVDSTTWARFAVLTDRGVSAEPTPVSEDPSGFRVDWGSAPADWTWPGRKPMPDQGLLWLRCDSNPERLPLRVMVHSRSIRHESAMTASVDRRGAEVVEEVSGEVAFGTLSKIDVAFPRDMPSQWDVEGVELSGREPLEQDPGGSRRYRLRFARDYSDTFRLRIRYRLPFVEAPSADREGRFRLAPIRILEGTSTGGRMLISAEPGVELRAEGPGWSPIPVDSTTPSESGPSVRFSLTRIPSEKVGPVEVFVRPGPQLALPNVVVSRLLLKTIQRADFDLATTAWFWVEARDGSMSVSLEPGSRWVRARVGQAELGPAEVELAAPNEYRLRFPSSTTTGPILVEMGYVVPASATGQGWPAPRLLGGGVIQQTIWDVQLLGSRAGLGTPSGWTDENEWYFDGLLWKRRPWKSSNELSQWLTGGNARYQVPETVGPGDQANLHRYLFSRVGPPENLHFRVFSRFILVLLCSGPVLIMGLLVLLRRPPPRMIAAAFLLVAFALVAFIDTEILILFLQSSALGVILFLSALFMHWALERRGRRQTGGEAGLITGPSSLGSSLDRTPGTRSDDSTAIRARPAHPSAVSTADHIVLTRVPGPDPDESSTSDTDLR